MTALHSSCANDHVEVSKLLLECGAEINAQDDDGVTFCSLFFELITENFLRSHHSKEKEIF